ncbi:MAG: (d)CMP kinase [Nitrospirae bacterium]|nr:(d)CMP kinase [Nitrospirota bacterium]
MYIGIVLRVVKTAASIVLESRVFNIQRGVDNLSKKLFRKINYGTSKKDLRYGKILNSVMETGIALYSKSGLHATVESLLQEISTGNSESQDSPAEVDSWARQIASIFQAAGLAPKAIAIDGAVGSGKSTLAKALANRLDMKWISLDHVNMDSPLTFQVGNVYEHHRLIRTQNMDFFDAIIYIDEPVELSKSKVLRRMRGGYLLDIMDFETHKRVGEKAFSLANGEEIRINGSYLTMKIRPAEGFHTRENVEKELKGKGLETDRLSLEQLMFLASEKTIKSGFFSYIDVSPYMKEVISGSISAIAGLIGKAR